MCVRLVIIISYFSIICFVRNCKKFFMDVMEGIRKQKAKTCEWGEADSNNFNMSKGRENGCLRKGNWAIVLKQHPLKFVPDLTLKIQYSTIYF